MLIHNYLNNTRRKTCYYTTVHTFNTNTRGLSVQARAVASVPKLRSSLHPNEGTLS